MSRKVEKKHPFEVDILPKESWGWWVFALVLVVTGLAMVWCSL